MRRGGPAAIAILLLLAGVASAAAEKTRIVLAPSRTVPIAGRPWTAVLVVSGARPPTIPVTASSGARRVHASARRWRGNRYRARLAFRSAGRWTLQARIGRARFRLGPVRVQAPPPQPILFAFPTEVGLDRNGALLLVDTSERRVVRIDPATGRMSVFARVDRPFGLAVTPAGDVYVTSDRTVRRIDTARRMTTVAQTDSDIGPLAVDATGNVYFTTVTRIFRIEGGAGPVTHYGGTGVEGDAGDGGPALQAQFRAPHGLAVGADGALYVSDTGNDRIRRIDPTSRVVSAFAPARIPGGLGVGPDGALYVAASGVHSVLRIDRNGAATVVAGTGVSGSTGDGGPATAARLQEPFDVAVAADGTLFIVQTGRSGRIRRVNPSGTISTLRRR
jgi:sugar lactone lactonase YvrE